jgi:DNA-binding response OmpR family regulator
MTGESERARILLVEDDDSLRRVVTQLLMVHEYDISPCPDA